MDDKEIKQKLKAALEQIKEVTADGKAHFGIILKNYLYKHQFRIKHL